MIVMMSPMIAASTVSAAVKAASRAPFSLFLAVSRAVALSRAVL
jgi:hypothetical protein